MGVKNKFINIRIAQIDVSLKITKKNLFFKKLISLFIQKKKKKLIVWVQPWKCEKKTLEIKYYIYHLIDEDT